jgi:hypothetical protein
MLLVSVVAASVDAQHVVLALDPAAHTADVRVELRAEGPGTVRLRMPEAAKEIVVLRESIEVQRVAAGEDHILLVTLSPGPHMLTAAYRSELFEDVAAGERAGAIHNLGVRAHVSPEGVFLSDDAGWHPVWLDDDDEARLVVMSAEIAPLEGWAFVVSGDPTDGERGSEPAPGEGSGDTAGERAAAADADGALARPPWSWRTPRPVPGLAVLGGERQVRGLRHMTPLGPVDIVMHVSDAHARLAPVFLRAASEYLSEFTERLGPYPFARFTIAEGFFSAGFAFPGFTMLGPQVVARGERSLVPGYLDHELLHAWWGNGVYVDDDEGVWSEALTTYCANYFHRVLHDGESAGREYRRDVLMGLSAHPERYDSAPLAEFRPGGEAGQFVGYSKGAFLFIMLENLWRTDAGVDRSHMFAALRRFAAENMGREASWSDLERAFEAELGAPLDRFFDLWVEARTVPETPRDGSDAALAAFQSQYAPPQEVEIDRSPTGDSVEVDPDFRLYRALPDAQRIPSLAATLGRGGYAVAAETGRAESDALVARLRADPEGKHRLILGREAAEAHTALLASGPDPIVIDAAGFTVGGVRYDAPTHAALHTMADPADEGRFVSVFVANADEAWSRARVLDFYTRDTTIVWRGDDVLARRTYEPDRRLPIPSRARGPSPRRRRRPRCEDADARRRQVPPAAARRARDAPSVAAGREREPLQLGAPREIARVALARRDEGERQRAIAVGEGDLAAGAAVPERAACAAAPERAEVPAGAPADRHAQRLI